MKSAYADPHVQLSERPRLPDLPEGRFGRLFPELPCQNATGDELLKYGAARGPIEYRTGVHQGLGQDNPRIAAGWPFFGQFVAHDITHDRSPLQETEDVSVLQNFRTPRLDLECIYDSRALTGSSVLLTCRNIPASLETSDVNSKQLLADREFILWVSSGYFNVSGHIRAFLIANVGVGAGIAADKNSKVTLVYEHALPNVPGKSINGVLVEYEPGGSSPAHTHPDSAFIYATVLEGAIRSQVNNGPVKVYRAGESFSEMPGDHHSVSANARETEPARLLVVFVVDTNEKNLTTNDTK